MYNLGPFFNFCRRFPLAKHSIISVVFCTFKLLFSSAEKEEYFNIIRPHSSIRVNPVLCCTSRYRKKFTTPSWRVRLLLAHLPTVNHDQGKNAAKVRILV